MGFIEKFLNVRNAANAEQAAQTTAEGQESEQAAMQPGAQEQAAEQSINGNPGDSAAEVTEQGEQEQQADQSADTPKTFTQEDVDKLLDAERQKLLGALSPEEKAQVRIKELESQLLKKELKESAIAALNKEGFPVGLAELLQYDSKESMETSLATMQASFKECVAAAIKEKLRGKTPEGLGGAAAGENNPVDMFSRTFKNYQIGG
ncbi:MAG: DUF4355 domain-containing protein [Oscillospiraceae bacterium]|jgi:hypothetical protein|nr:DUF4355 domain-containing protein [Oscillospiraceae bacterium]